MKGFFVLLLAAAAISLVICDQVYSESQLAAWNKYKTDHGKTYDAAEDSRRLRIFTDNVNRIDAHNAKFAAGEVSYRMGLNQFTDRLPEELPRGLGRP